MGERRDPKMSLKKIYRELEWNQRNLFEKWKGKMGFYYLLNSSKDYLKIENEDKKDEEF